MRSVYLDNGATSFPKAPGVGEAMARHVIESGVNINRGTYEKASGTAMAVLECREMLKEMFHFKGKESQVIFTPGHTYGLNQILRGFLKPGDHVIVSSMEHNAVMRPLVDMDKIGIQFDRIPADEAGRTKAEDIIPLIKSNTKLVMVNHASNVSGTILPLQEISNICYERGIPIAVDAAQTAGHMDIDMSKMHISALSVPGHKGLLGPQGIGALLLDKDFESKLTPIVTGGTGSASNSEIQPAYLPDKYESGTLNLPGIIGLYTAVDFVMKTGIENLQQHDRKLTKLFLDGVKDLPLRVAGPADVEQQVGVVSIDFTGKDNAEIAFRLEREFGIMTRCGLHCAPNAHKTLGTFPHGTVRFSFGYSTTEEEIEYAVNAIKQMA